MRCARVSASRLSLALVGAFVQRNRSEPAGRSTYTPSRNSMWKWIAAPAQCRALSGFRPVGLLNVVSATPARPSVAKASRTAPLNRLATNPGEKCGLALCLFQRPSHLVVPTLNQGFDVPGLLDGVGLFLPYVVSRGQTLIAGRFTAADERDGKEANAKPGESSTLTTGSWRRCSEHTGYPCT